MLRIPEGGDQDRAEGIRGSGRQVLIREKLQLVEMDETDSGLDIDALRIVANGINTLHRDDKSVLVVTHYQRLLDYIVPDFVHH